MPCQGDARHPQGVALIPGSDDPAGRRCRRFWTRARYTVLIQCPYLIVICTYKAHPAILLAL